MPRRYPSPHLVKTYHSYEVGELAEKLGVHKQTVRRWIKEGLPVCDGIRPTIILGRHLKPWLKEKRSHLTTKLRPGQAYCFCCKQPSEFFGNFADLQSFGPNMLNLTGFCEICETTMFRRVGLKNFNRDKGELKVSLPEALEQLIRRAAPSLNDHLN